ncbi:hypothetical protein VTL71DRAFT_12095 [Oculimacula yallundae]|uniref:Hcy-binding domain-containing protein n=1 Tax=Oculimacula yallundae TaxID=86028 RepID=A0ABR4CT51_9HELO
MAPPTSIHLLDGGLGTTLGDQYACKFTTETPLWSSHLLISDPGTLSKVQTAFADAGSDVILTATYQASYEGFERTKLGSDGEGERGIGEREAGAFMRGAVRIARGAFGHGKAEEGERIRAKVALSLGAFGATMIPSQEYTGKYDEERLSVSGLREWHLKRLRAFTPDAVAGLGNGRGSNSLEGEERRKCWADVDLVAFETLPLKEEITAVRSAMGELEAKGVERREFWIGCVFPGEGMYLPDRSSIEDIVKLMLDKREGLSVPMGVGINCTKVGKLEALVLEFEKEVGALILKGEADWPALVVYPDGTDGEVYDTTKKEWVKSEAGHHSEMSWDETVFGIVERARNRGLWKSIIVGGCCKTTPDDISNLRKRIDNAV